MTITFGWLYFVIIAAAMIVTAVIAWFASNPNYQRSRRHNVIGFALFAGFLAALLPTFLGGNHGAWAGAEKVELVKVEHFDTLSGAPTFDPDGYSIEFVVFDSEGAPERQWCPEYRSRFFVGTNLGATIEHYEHTYPNPVVISMSSYDSRECTFTVTQDWFDANYTEENR